MSYSSLAGWIRARLWIPVAAGCVPWVIWVGGLLHTGGTKDLGGNLVGADHMAFFHAASLIRGGESYRLYNYDELRHKQKDLIGWDWYGFEAYRNPPFYALLYVPTAGYSYYVSFAIWTLVGFALFSLAILLLRPAAPGRALLWSLTFFPVFATVSFGQNTFISLAIFAGIYRLLVNDWRFAAGMVAGLLWFKPQLLLGPFIWWAFQPGYYARSWAGATATGAILAGLSWLAVPDGSNSFVLTLRSNLGFKEFGAWNIVSPKGFWELILPGLPLVSLILAALCSLAGIGVAWVVKQRTGAPIAAMFPVAIFLSLWASPHTLVYEWALLIPAAIVLWEELPGHADVWLCLFALAWVALAISTPLAKSQISAGAPVVVLLGVPILGFVGVLASRELVRAIRVQPRPVDAHPIAPA